MSTANPSSAPAPAPTPELDARSSTPDAEATPWEEARNLAGNPRCTLSTGRNTTDDGLDVIVEGRAERVIGRDRLERLRDM